MTWIIIIVAAVMFLAYQSQKRHEEHHRNFRNIMENAPKGDSRLFKMHPDGKPKGRRPDGSINHGG